METITTTSPQITSSLNPHLLSMPIIKYDAENLRKIGDWLEEKILTDEFRKHPDAIGKLIVKHLKFMELYERAKIKEGESKSKTFIKANAPFYRPRLANKNDQRAFEELDDRRKTSTYDRRNNALSKI